MLRNGLDSTKEEKENLLSKNDVILILCIVFIGLILLLFIKIGQKGGAQVVVSVDGEEYGRYSLEEDRELTIDDGDYSNTIVIKEGKVSMEDADCPDQICVHHTPIYRDGETIVCLPHRLVISVEDGNEEQDNSIDAIIK